MKSLQSFNGNGYKATGVFSLALAACLLLFLPGCQGPLGMQDTARTGSLSVTLEGPPPGGLARTALPDGSLVSGDFDKFVFTFAAGAGNTATFGPVTIHGGLEDGDFTIDEIPLGYWDLTVRAYVYDDGEYEAKAEYVYSNLYIAPTGGSATIRLDPLPYGYGNFAWEVTFPAAVTEVTVGIYAWGTTPPFIGAPVDDFTFGPSDFNDAATPGYLVLEGYIEGLAAGTYWAFFRLSDGDYQAMPYRTILRIYRNMISVFTRDLPFDPATDVELAIASINDAAWAPVEQAWTTGTATTVAAALAQVQAAVDAVVSGFDVEAEVSWYPAAPAPGETGLAIPAQAFTVLVTCDADDTYSASIGITVSVTFLPSNAQAAYAAINAVPTWTVTQEWLDNTGATTAEARDRVQLLVDTALLGIPAGAIVEWADGEEPTLDGTAYPGNFDFGLVITGNDSTTGSITISVSINFLADGLVNPVYLIAEIDAANNLLIGLITSLDGNDVSMDNLWATAEAIETFTDAIATAQVVAGDFQAQGQAAVNAARDALYAARLLFMPLRQPGNLERHLLAGAIAAAELRVEATYTVGTWGPFALALGNAITVYDNPTSTSAQLISARSVLEGAYEDLVTRVAAARAALGLAIGWRDQDDYTPATWTVFAPILAAAQGVYADGAATEQELIEARETLEAAWANLVTVADQNAVNAARDLAQPAVDAIAATNATTAAGIMAVVTGAIADNVGAEWTVAFEMAPPAGIGVPGLITGTITLTVVSLDVGNASATVTVSLVIPALPAEGTLNITWDGFNNPLASVNINVNPATGAITLTGVDLQLANVRWYVGMTPLDGGTDTGITVDPLPPLVTIRAIGDGRPYSIVIDTYAGTIF